MATNKPIQSVVVTSAVSSITFSGIDQSYTDLVIMADFTISVANASVFLRFNGDTSASFSDTSISGTGSAQYTDRDSSATQIRVSAQRTAQTATDRQHFTVHINDYSNTTTWKTCISRYGSIGGVEAFAGQWRNTAAINSITLGFASSYTFSPGTIVSLYGIKSGSTQANGGDLVTTDGNYWYHAFTNTGAFTPLKPLTADILVIAGGGGGAGQNTAAGGSGGGGAGGLLYFASQSLTTTNYTCTVGSGGPGGSSSSNGTVGVDSRFGALTLVKGGGYGAKGGSGTTGGNGGSGGGGAYGGTPTAGGSPTSGQGNAGGNGTSYQFSGGGGGAGAAGSSQTPGVGSSAYSSWGLATGTGQNVAGTVYYAGGGAGAGGTTATAGGYGGGATAGLSGTAPSGTANTGGGGGGGGDSYSYGSTTGGTGGSGIVIVRYPV